MEGGFWEEGQEATIGFLRHSEIKHGRVAMAAFVGYLVHAQGWTWPFPMRMDGTPWPKLEDAGSVPALWDALPQASKWQIVLAIGALELWDEYQFDLEFPRTRSLTTCGEIGLENNNLRRS